MKKIALITGSSSNLGMAISRKFLNKGYVVYSTAQSELNITSRTSCFKFIQKIVKVHNKIDVLVNCAGITSIIGPSLEKSDDDYLRALDINAVGAFRLTKEAVKYMGKKSRGNIINISSLNGIISLPNYGIYSASKHALEAMSFALRQELRNKNVYVTNILPGAIQSENKINVLQKHKPAREKFPILKYLMPFLPPERIAESVLTTTESDFPPARIVLGSDAKITAFLMKVLPFSLWDQLIFYIWNHK